MLKKQQNLRLFAEFILLFIGTPLLVIGEPRSVKVAVILGFSVFALFMLRYAGIRDANKEWNWKAVRPALPYIMPRVVVFCSFLTMLLLLLQPGRLFSFPLQRPGFWAIVMLWYPVLSVLPQELIYRSLFFHRYGKLFKTERLRQFASAAVFGWAHIIFPNVVAVTLCTIGGYVFAHSYRKYNSLAVAWLEHSIYGCFLFTVGLGWYFYGGGAGR